LQHFAHEEGRVLKQGNVFRYEYNLTDHLGNVRISFADVDEDGSIDETMEVLTSQSFYPFGLRHGGTFAQSGVANQYRYNGKELQDELGLGWYDYGARMYDASVGRWNGVDALADSFPTWSTYHYVLDNPINAIDPDGERIIFVNGKIGFGSPSPGFIYWNPSGSESSFVKGAKDFLNDYDAYYTEEDYDYSSSTRSRKRQGREYAKKNLGDLTKGLNKEIDVFRIVSHSMGVAFSEGIIEVLKAEGWIVDRAYYFNTFQAADIEINRHQNLTGIGTFVHDYQTSNDPVINNPVRSSPGDIENADVRFRVYSNSDTEYRHRDPIDSRNAWDIINEWVTQNPEIKLIIKN